MSGRVIVGESKLRPGHRFRWVEHAQAESRFKQMLYRAIDIARGKQAILHGEGQRRVFRAAAQVGSRFNREGIRLFQGKNVSVALMNIADGPAIGNDVALEAPLAAQRVQQKMIRACRLTMHGVVRAHDGIRVALHDRGAKCGGIRVGKIVRRNGHVEAMTQGFRAAVNGKMLGGGNRFQILGIVALQPGDESYANATGEKRIFSVSLLSASPARIAKDVDVRRPEGQAEIAAGISVLESVVVLGASFGRNDIGDAMNKVGVPGGSEPSASLPPRSVSQVAARPMACGKTVACPARATPCKPSFHQL